MLLFWVKITNWEKNQDNILYFVLVEHWNRVLYFLSVQCKDLSLKNIFMDGKLQKLLTWEEGEGGGGDFLLVIFYLVRDQP